MKLLLILALALLTSCASLNTYNAKAYKDSPVIFENDKGLAVVEDGLIVPYAYEGTNPDEWYQYNFKTQGVDEKEAKALRWMAAGLAGDVVSSQIGFNRGCIEKNVLAKGIGPAGMTLYSLGNFGLFWIAADSSTIYQATLKHDTRKIYAGAIFKGALTAKNLITKC